MTFFFYDLETSGIDARWHRVMQFAGQRTNAALEPIGEPYNVYVKVTDEVLPEPEAVLITGITPQQTKIDGISEREFCELFQTEIAADDTTLLGYNSIRFDDEFIRHTLFRNFYDPYEREWSNGRSRWDILDAVRMMRALRPEGIEWPITDEGKATNRLEALSKANELEHSNAHDALADVNVTIEIARLLRASQPKLFDHLLSLRDKRKAAKIVSLDGPKPIVHSTGRIGSEHLNTSVVIPICPHPENSNAVLAFDLRYSPKPFADFNALQLAEAAFTPLKELLAADKKRLPIKAIHLNKSPAVAPLGVLDEASQQRVGLSLKQVETHLNELAALDGFTQRIYAAWQSQEARQLPDDVEGQLYGGFISDGDKKKMTDVRQMKSTDLASWQPDFADTRLNELFPRYKARNFPQLLSRDEQVLWEQYRLKRLNDSTRGPSFTTYMNSLARLAEERADDDQAIFLLQELQLYAESIAPFDNQALDL